MLLRVRWFCSSIISYKLDWKEAMRWGAGGRVTRRMLAVIIRFWRWYLSSKIFSLSILGNWLTSPISTSSSRSYYYVKLYKTCKMAYHLDRYIKCYCIKYIYRCAINYFKIINIPKRFWININTSCELFCYLPKYIFS